MRRLCSHRPLPGESTALARRPAHANHALVLHPYHLHSGPRPQNMACNLLCASPMAADWSHCHPHHSHRPSGGQCARCAQVGAGRKDFTWLSRRDTFGMVQLAARRCCCEERERSGRDFSTSASRPRAARLRPKNPRCFSTPHTLWHRDLRRSVDIS